MDFADSRYLCLGVSAETRSWWLVDRSLRVLLCFQKVNPLDASTVREQFEFDSYLSIMVGVWHYGDSFAQKLRDFKIETSIMQNT